MTGIEADRVGRRLTWAVLAWFLLMALSIGAGGLLLSSDAPRVTVDPRMMRVTVVSHVECWDDFTCSDGSTLDADTFECARPSHVDTRGAVDPQQRDLWGGAAVTLWFDDEDDNAREPFENTQPVCRCGYCDSGGFYPQTMACRYATSERDLDPGAPNFR